MLDPRSGISHRATRGNDATQGWVALNAAARSEAVGVAGGDVELLRGAVEKKRRKFDFAGTLGARSEP
eukprot:1767534-Alexandrium_andersonii.AAC.1